MGGIAFAKYQGLGNDFVVVTADALPEHALTETWAAAVCDRHLGIGADGVLWVSYEKSPEKPLQVRLRIRNADGSSPEMCGNGLRCVAAFLADRALLAPGEEALVHTDAGLRSAIPLAKQADGTWDVRAQLGRVRVETDALIVGKNLCAFPVDVGNPHAVVFDPVEASEEERLARAIQLRREAFPRGANVEFVAPPSGKDAPWLVRVFERGVGWTRACGTGAVAVAAAAMATGRVTEESIVRIGLPGGELRVLLQSDREGNVSGRVRDERDVFRAQIEGPARGVFEGTISADLLSAQEARTK